MSVRAPVGDLNIAFEDCCIGRGLAAIHSEHPSFCLYLMRSLHSKLDAFNGEGTVFGSINGGALKSLPIAQPKTREIQAFEKEAEMDWLRNLFESDFDKLIENGTDEELEINYERRRQEWLSRGQDGTGEKTPEMKRLDSEMEPALRRVLAKRSPKKP